MACEQWPTDDGPCGKPEVERLVFMHTWINSGAPLPVCEEHLEEFVAEQDHLHKVVT